MAVPARLQRANDRDTCEWVQLQLLNRPGEVKQAIAHSASRA